MQLPPMIRIKTEPGYLFHGDFPGTVCFVPQTALQQTGTALTLDIPNYHRTGWAAKNVELNPGKTIGSHLYPKLNQPITPKDDTALFVMTAQQ